MKKINQILKCSISVLLFTLMLGCSKKDEAPTPAIDQSKSILTANTWKLLSTERITTSGNISETIPSCKLDDLWEYNQSGSFSKFPGTNKCSTTDLTVQGTWELVNDNKGLKVSISGFSYTDEILLLENNKLKLKFVTGSSAFIDTYIAN